MPIGGGKFSLEKTWHSAAPSTTTLNASGNFTFPYGRYSTTIYGYGGSAQPGTYSGTNPGYSYSDYNPTTYGPGFNYTVFFAWYYAINEYGSNPRPAVYQTYFNNGGGVNCPSPSTTYYPSYVGNTFPQNPGPGWYSNTNYSCTPGTVTFPGNLYYVFVPGNANYNPTIPASPSNAMGVTVPGNSYYPAPSAVPVTYYSYPDNATYPVSVSYGGQIVIQYR